MILSITLLLAFILTLVNGNSNWEARDESYQTWLQTRGGSTMVAPPPEESLQPKPPALPSMNMEHVSLSLRYTCEMNRRLQEATHLNPSIHDQYEKEPDNVMNTRGGVQIHPSQFWQPPIRAPEVEDTQEQLTLFHAKSPRAGKTTVRRGANRWGPDLLKYLEHVTRLLNVHDNPLVLSLAILYLDRASSVETPRSNGAPACPYVSPRTVHRLVLVSLLIATKAVYPSLDLDVSSLGIPPMQLQHMENWMREALGDEHLYVQPEQLEDFFYNWERTWNKPKIRVKAKKMRRTLVRPIQREQISAAPQQQFCEAPPDHLEQPYQSNTSVSEAALSLWA